MRTKTIRAIAATAMVTSLATAGVVLSISPVQATPAPILYVDQSATCSDTGSGKLALPYCTAQAGVNAAGPGQTVQIRSAASAYGPLVITKSGTPSQPITIEGVIAGAGASALPVVQIRASTGGAAAITLSNVHDVHLFGLVSANLTSQDGIDVVGSSNITLDRIRTAGSAGIGPGNGIVIDGGSSSVHVTRGALQLNANDAVQVKAGAQHIVIAGNAVIGNGDGIVVNGASDVDVTNNTIGEVCSGVLMSGGSSGVIENDVIGALSTSTPCAGSQAALTVDAASASGVTADYNALSAQTSGQAPRTEYSWAGTTYASVAAFQAGTSRGAHDIDLLTSVVLHLPNEGSPLIDSANSSAPGALDSDFYDFPIVDDALVANTGVGKADRGAFERQDTLTQTGLAVTPSVGMMPLPVTINLGTTTSSWGEATSTSVDFGDGTAPVAAASGTVPHTYAAAGTYTVTLTTTDTDGTFPLTWRQVIKVADKNGPVARIKVTPSVYTSATFRSYIPNTMDVDTAGTTDANEIASETIDFGDGTSTSSPQLFDTSHTYTQPGTYSVKVTVADFLNRTSTASTTFISGDLYVPISPIRVYDSRSFGTDHVAGHSSVKLSQDQLNAIEGGGATVTVTVANAKQAGYITVYHDGDQRPNSSVLNFVPGKAVANEAFAPADSTGDAVFYNASAGPIDLIIDTFGQLSPSQFADSFKAMSPTRVLDTRHAIGAPTAPIAGRHSVDFKVGGLHNVPSDAAAVVLNITTTDTKTTGFLTAYGEDTIHPGTSNSNWSAGQTVANLVVVPVTNGRVVIDNGANGSADFIADVVGYYANGGTEAVYLPHDPTRVLDTRYGTGAPKAVVGPGKTIKVKIATLYGVPAGASAVALNLTVTDAAGGGFLTVYPSGVTLPTASSINFAAGQTVANMTDAMLGSDGSIEIYNGGSKSVDIIADLVGSFYEYPAS